MHALWRSGKFNRRQVWKESFSKEKGRLSIFFCFQATCYFFNNCRIPPAMANRSKAWVNCRKACASMPRMGLSVILEIIPIIKTTAATMMNKSMRTETALSTFWPPHFPESLWIIFIPFFNVKLFEKLYQNGEKSGQGKQYQTSGKLFFFQYLNRI